MKMYQWGSVSYVAWGVMHAMIGAQILIINLSKSTHDVVASLYQEGLAATPLQLGSVVDAIVNQHAWNLLWFGLFAVVVGIKGNWHNDRASYWANLTVVSLADIGFIVAILLPGYISVAVGIWGPLLWLLALVFSTLGLKQAGNKLSPAATH